MDMKSGVCAEVVLEASLDIVIPFSAVIHCN